MPGHFDSLAARQRCDIQIKKFGGLGALRQPNMADRPITVGVADFTAMERMGGVSNPADRKALVSMLDPTTGQPLSLEPSEKDVLIRYLKNNVVEQLKIVAPPKPIGTDDVVLFWKLQVRI